MLAQDVVLPSVQSPFSKDGSGVVGSANGSVAVSVSGLVRSFGAHRVLDHLNLVIPAGQFVALLGASGCGKSTLLRAVAGLDREFSGDVRVPRRRAVAFQSPRLLPWKRVWKNVVLGLPGHPDRSGALAVLTEVDLRSHADVWPKTLSGGEAQRVALARALVRQPDLLLLDEPFASLDALTRMQAQALVAELWQRHDPAVLLVTHDVEEALLLADRALLLRDGKLVHDEILELPRPRHVSSPGFIQWRSTLLSWLGVENA